MKNKSLVLAAALAVSLPTGGCDKAVRFGVVADIQYRHGEPVGTRYYGASLGKLRDAVSRFNRENVQFVINLGDTIDGGIESFEAVMPLFKPLKVPLYNVMGNHDLAVGGGNEELVLPALGLKDDHYAFTKGNWTFIVLDGFELRVPVPADEILKRESEALYSTLLARGKQNAQAWNGGIGSRQLAWLERRLEGAVEAGHNVLLLCHFPVRPEGVHNLWNADELVALLERHRQVKACFCGHDHAGGYILRNGIHYLTFRGMIETPDQNAFAIVTLAKDRIEVQGFGREPSRSLELLSR